MFVGRDWEMAEISNQDGKYEGWRLINEKTDDGTKLLVLQTGLFSLSDSTLNAKEESFEIEQNNFTVELSAIPLSLEKINAMQKRRKGDLSSYADNEIRLGVKSTSFREMNLVVVCGDYEWHFNKYHRNKYLLLYNLETFNDPARLFDLFTHSLKIMCTRVGLYEVERDFAKKGENGFTAELWGLIPEYKSWSGYLIYNLLGAAHLSPLVFGTHLIQNSRLEIFSNHLEQGSDFENLDQIDDDTKKRKTRYQQIGEKIASHGAEYTLSLGNLWPEIFPKMTDEQIAVFLENLPTQEEYTNTYLADIDRGEFPLEHQGIYHIMTALRKALSLENPAIADINELIPDFYGNYLLQTLYVFRHPDDEEIIEITKQYQITKEQLLENLFQNRDVSVTVTD
ncbi:hypothetical protein A2153_04935 [Candidatus Gottesmanbacteria bacterium RBG_16_38_7b]|uniref:Uncharacterized protein n=1 Tax=Candidatus Gottesmanbacteria bacterium RBG_16_38_7b TaxID=1798372 RepID=A0A1F5YKZ8_9BACT|nr:MAG: hypothetical protein A2153_04935 [Candidatus Gottesmanbacteria bacterium RBG_16_38_7b]